jgi:hypothetical protein
MGQLFTIKPDAAAPRAEVQSHLPMVRRVHRLVAAGAVDHEVMAARRTRFVTSSYNRVARRALRWCHHLPEARIGKTGSGPRSLDLPLLKPDAAATQAEIEDQPRRTGW